ncbi:MAG TPA: hypothetical protein VFN02_12745, partial [Ktedonobacteraceae bacterium]|nr:hypothetical protein [Ktedonobacteraceae bacterium]
MAHSVRRKEPMSTPDTTPQADIQAARSIIRVLFGSPESRTFATHYWDCTTEVPVGGREPSFTLILRRPGALRRMLFPPSELALGEGYLRDDFD